MRIALLALAACRAAPRPTDPPPRLAPAVRDAGPPDQPREDAPAPPSVGRGSGPSGCFTRAEYEARSEQLFAEAEASAQAALAKDGFSSVTLPFQQWAVPDLGPPPEPRVRTRAGKRVLMLGSAGVTPCATATMRPFELARRGDAIFVVRRLYESRRLEIPVCPPSSCAQPPPASGCGGAAPAPTGFAVELPANTEFGGEHDVHLVQYVATPRLVGSDPCPPSIAPQSPP